MPRKDTGVVRNVLAEQMEVDLSSLEATAVIVVRTGEIASVIVGGIEHNELRPIVVLRYSDGRILVIRVKGDCLYR